MSINYSKTTWVNGSAPALNATNLNKMEQGIKDACDGVDGMVYTVEVSSSATSGDLGGPTGIALFSKGQLGFIKRGDLFYSMEKSQVAVESKYTCVYDNVLHVITVDRVDTDYPWTFSEIPLEITANKTTSLTAGSTNTQYPGALAVYNFVMANRAIPENVSTAAGMDAVLVAANVGKVYRYTGTTTSTYTNGDLYEVTEST